MKSNRQEVRKRQAVCVVRLDRIRVIGGSDPNMKLPSLAGFNIIRDSFVRQQTSTRTYRRCRQLLHKKTGMLIFWQYSPQRSWLKPWRITLIGDDRTGLARQELTEILALCPSYKLVLVEVAFDFTAGSGIDQAFVKRQGVFGKSRPFPDRGGQGQLRYGTRNSGKLVRTYFKSAIDAYRVEVEFHSKILRQLLINQVLDLPRLRNAISPSHIKFVTVRWGALQLHLKRRAAGLRLLKRAKDRSDSIYRLMYFLRRSGVKNVHRFLVPLKSNAIVRDAAQKWSDGFREVTREK